MPIVALAPAAATNDPPTKETLVPSSLNLCTVQFSGVREAQRKSACPIQLRVILAAFSEMLAGVSASAKSDNSVKNSPFPFTTESPGSVQVLASSSRSI